MFDASVGIALGNALRQIKLGKREKKMGDDQMLDFLDDLPDDADDYEVEVFDGDEDDNCAGGACKI